MNYIDNLNGTIPVRHGNSPSSRDQPKKVRVGNLKSALVGKENCEWPEWRLVLGDPELLKRHTAKGCPEKAEKSRQRFCHSATLSEQQRVEGLQRIR